jgi:Secretion system C-terminal sorting domain
MQNKKVRLSIVLLLCIALTGVHAQEALTTSGGNASGSGGSANYSVGQIFYTTNSGINGSVAQGVQQPFEISVVTAIEEAKEISINIMAYPNPATDYLILKIEGELQAQYIASLYDLNGKLLEYKKVEGNETTISMEKLVPATYFLKLIQGSKEIKTFKIIKTKNYEKDIFTYRVVNFNILLICPGCN